MTLFVHEGNTDYLDSIARLRLMDDDFMRIVFKDEDVVRQFLEIILDRKVDIIECHAQYDINNILGRAISIDVLVKDGDDYINIEVQRDTKGAHPKRARFHGSLIDANTSFPNEQWDELPNVIIIFITETDVLGYGLPIYHICSIISENTQWFKEGREIIYVNASIQEDTALGRLMHDMFCTNPSEMHYEFLRKRVRYYKENEGGKRKMCEIWEEIKNKGKLEGLREGEAIGEARGEARGKAIGETYGMMKSIKKLMSKNGYTLEEALDFLDIPNEERSLYIEIFAS